MAQCDDADVAHCRPAWGGALTVDAADDIRGTGIS